MKLYHKTPLMTKDTVEKLALTPGDLQASIDLQELASFLLDDTGLPAGNALNFIIPQFDPDHSEYLIFEMHYQNPVTGDRGSSIKFIQRLHRCSYQGAVGYLRGWLHRSRYRPDATTFTEPVKLPPKPIQLQLALDLQPRRKAAE